MTTTALLCSCGRPSRLPLCQACANDLDRLLARVPDLLEDLEITLTRQDRVSTGGGRRTKSEPPLAFNLAAAQARTVLVETIESWGAALVDLGVCAPVRAAHDLRRHLGALRQLPDAGDALAEVTHAVAFAVRAIDLPRSTSWVGDCGAALIGADGQVVTCGGRLLASILEDEVVTCPACGAVYAVADRRDVLLDAAREVLLPAADLARFARGVGFSTTQNAVDGLVRRHTLTPAGAHADGRPTYRVGDLLDHLTRRRTA